MSRHSFASAERKADPRLAAEMTSGSAVIPDSVDVLFVSRDEGAAAERPAISAGKFFNSFFEGFDTATFTSSRADGLGTADEHVNLVLLALDSGNQDDCELLGRVVGLFPAAGIIALVNEAPPSTSHPLCLSSLGNQLDARLLKLGAADVLRYHELEVGLCRHVILQALRFTQREKFAVQVNVPQPQDSIAVARTVAKPLAGLVAGQIFMDVLVRELAICSRASTRLSVMCIELVKPGEERLRILAARMRSMVRAGDLLAQADNRTVLLLQTGVQGPQQSLDFAARLHAVLAARNPKPEQIRVRVGIACHPDSGVRPASLVAAAKKSIAHLRRQKRDGTCVHEPEFTTTAYTRPATLDERADLRVLLERGELEVYFQPIVSELRLAPAAFECLLRWNHPTRGVLPASEFLAGVGEAIIPVGNWIVRQACAALGEWRDLGWRHLQISMNVGVAEICHDRFASVLEQAVIAHDLSYQQVILELRAAELAADSGKSNLPDETDLREKLEALDLRGVQIAIDNVGAGGSTIEILRRYPASILKLDAGVTASLGEDPVSAAIVHGIASMADSLAMRLVAEGIETSQQLRHLSNIGIGLLQGHFLYRPMQRSEATRWLASRPEVASPVPP